MATIWAHQDGTLFRIDTPELGGLVFDPPTEAGVQRLDFDGASNKAGLTTLLSESWVDRYRLLAGVLTRDGVVVTIAADSPGEQDRKLLAQIWTALNTPATTLTQAQIKTILRYLVRQASAEFRNQ